MSFGFVSKASFNQRLDCWNVSNVESMFALFLEAGDFNQPLNTWDVSSVKDMDAMFAHATTFNHPLNAWKVSNIQNMEGMFHDAKAFNQALNSWDVSSVKNMHAMFAGATAFNQPLDAWDVSSVESMHSMFVGAIAFNQPLTAWKVSNVQRMNWMFVNAKAFNQDLCPWASRALRLTSAVSMFYDSACDNKNDPILRNLPYQTIYPGPFCHECIGESYNPRSPGTSLTQCTTSSQCNAGDCNNGSGHICRCSKKGICRLKAGRCVRDADCKGGAACKNSKCREPKPGSRGSQCTVSNQCNSGNCNYKDGGRICKCSKKGICELKRGNCDGMLQNADCRDGTICKKDRCTAPRPRLPPRPPTDV